MATHFSILAWKIPWRKEPSGITNNDPHELYSLLGSSVHGDSPGKNTEMGCHSLLQGIFPTQGLNPSLPHCRRILYHLSHQGRPQECMLLLLLLSRFSRVQPCATPIDDSPPGSSTPGFLQARIPEWVAISFSNA